MQREVDRAGLPGAPCDGDTCSQHLRDDVLQAAVDAVARCLAPGGVVVVERSARASAPAWPAPLEPLDDRRYGETQVWFAERPA